MHARRLTTVVSRSHLPTRKGLSLSRNLDPQPYRSESKQSNNRQQKSINLRIEIDSPDKAIRLTINYKDNILKPRTDCNNNLANMKSPINKISFKSSFKKNELGNTPMQSKAMQEVLNRHNANSITKKSKPKLEPLEQPHFGSTSNSYQINELLQNISVSRPKIR